MTKVTGVGNFRAAIFWSNSHTVIELIYPSFVTRINSWVTALIAPKTLNR